MNRRSIRLRALAAVIAVTSVMLVIAGGLIYALLRDGLVRQLDARLMTAARGLTQAFESDGNTIRFEWEGVDIGSTFLFRAWDDSAHVIAESTGDVKLKGGNRPPLGSQSPKSASTRFSDASPARIVLLKFPPHVDDEHQRSEASEWLPPDSRSGMSTVTLEVAAPLTEVETVLALAKRRLLVVMSGAITISALILWWVTGIVLKPVNAMAARIDTLDASVLSERVDVESCPLELRPVAVRLNEFIDRLEQAFQRERTTTANIAHELRTPLSGLKAAIELAESRPRKVEYYQDTLADCRRLTNDLQTLVERTMLLSRLDAGKLGLNPEPVNPSELLPQLWKETVRNLATPSGASLPTAKFRIDPVLSVVVDRSCLIQIVRNLLTNAASHGDPSQPVVIEAQRAENRVEIIVTNHSPGLSQQDLCQLKQRFFQLDQNRARTGRHAGLGLSICDELARQLNGKLTLSLAIGGRFQATMSLPSERPPPTNGELSSPGRSPSMSV